MPEIPALPPADAPSFSERLSFDRPRTAPAKQPVRIPHRGTSFTDAAAFARKIESRGMLPPLPLRLRPPLRKKKSFSRASIHRVSTWLFNGADHGTDISLESITNEPKPLSGEDGFYQTLKPASNQRSSLDTFSTVSDWSAAEEQQTLPTSTSAHSPAARAADTPPSEHMTPLSRPKTQVAPPKRTSVGVAF